MADGGRACPYDSANIFSKITFWWLNPFFALGSKHDITSDNICEVSQHDDSNLLESKLDRIWKDELQRHAEGGKARLLLAVFKTFKWQFILPGLLLFFVEALKISQPVLIGILVSYLNGDDGYLSTEEAYGVGAGLGFTGILLMCFNPTAFFILQHVSMRMKVAVGALIYRKVLTLSAEAFQQTSAGQIVNHLSTDIEKFTDITCVLHYLWISPLSIGVVMYLMYRQVGVACLWGLLVIALVVPLQSGLANLFGRLRYRIAAYADQRIQLMTETVLGMRVVKMHCWEFPFQKILMKLRKAEVFLTRLGQLILAFNLTMTVITVRILFLILLTSAIHYNGESTVTPQVIFTLNGLSDCLVYTAFYFPSNSWEKMAKLTASMHRVQEIGITRIGALLRAARFGLEEKVTRGMVAILAVASDFPSLSTGSCFQVIGLAECIRLTGFFFVPYSIECLTQLWASADRVEKFLLLDEKKDQVKDLQLTRSIHRYNEPDSDWAIDIDHMTARWPLVYTEGARRFQKKGRNRSSTSSMKSLLHESDTDHAFSLKYMSLQIKKGEILAVVGVVGSGKSSLLMSLIGELPFDIGQISVNGEVSYCAQLPWIFGGTVRENILFGKEFDSNHYQAVVKACGLSRDLDLLPQGDQTFVGEQGLQLSGGQRARVSLARCIYHDADTYLLDDPLSAVDASVGGHIFERCIKEYLEDKTVVLVTHQLQYLKRCDRIVVLRDGSIHDVGTYEELKERGMDMRALVVHNTNKHTSDATLEAEEEEKQIMLESKMVDPGTGQAEEDVVTGSVGLRVYWDYFVAGLGHLWLPLLLPLWLGGPALFCFSDWMLTKWIGEQSKYDKASTDTTSSPTSSTKDNGDDGLAWDNMSESFHLYIIGLVSSFGVYILYSTLYLQIAATAGQRLHDNMLIAIMNSVCRFFDVHPVGQVLNRFSRDLGLIDDVLAVIGFVVTLKTVQFLGFITVTLIVNPWLLIALVPILAAVIFLRVYAVRTLRQVKRLEAKARSPVLSHVSDTVLGLGTIRALNKRDQFLTEFDNRQNQHTSVLFLYLSSYRWMSIRMLMAVVFYMNVIIFVSLQLVDTIDGNLLALSLIYCISMGEPFEFYMRATADLETFMTSVERVQGYTKLEQEASKFSDKPLSPEWPARGAITFSKTSLKYSSDGPYVLKQIDCHIKGKEKIGIVGRTGSGKSSLIAALFRLAEPTGLIFIDGTDVCKIGIHDLRKKLSVIPQSPFLFSHTLRWNLDPLEEFSDERLWKALEQVQMREKVEQMSNKLYTEMMEGGQNLSVGQRQLICLARAILKCNRILVLDEATASVDEETDAIIQRTIRSRFRESTVLTIAHRLYTVMDCDRIMVLADGELKEFDTPYNLLQDHSGFFSHLVTSMGKNQSKQLRALAELSQHKRTSASLQHQRALMLATEQLAQSMEDLRQGQQALSWNRFNTNMSTDSLDKIEDSPGETRKRPIGPSQKLIRRKSPGRPKKTDDNEDLVSYDSPPRTLRNSDDNRTRTPQVSDNKHHEDSSSSREGDGKRNEDGHGRSWKPSPGNRGSSSPGSPKQFVEYEGEIVQYRRKDRGDRRLPKHKESDIDAQDGQDHRSSPSSSTDEGGSRKYGGAERNSSSASTRPLLQGKHPSLPPLSSMRVLSGTYVPVTQKEEEEREQFV